MSHDLTKTEPNLVKVTRKPKGPGDLNPIEHFVGYLVDVEGNDIESPEVGQPIYLTGDEAKDLPWLFATDPIYSMEVYATHWAVVTEQGVHFDIENERLIQ
jgi:hypothetical protein